MALTFTSSVFLRYRERVLLIEHNLLKCWIPVGGALEAGETPLQAAKREAKEETGLTAIFPEWPNVPDGTPPGFIGYEEHEAGPKGTHMNFCFLADVDSDQVVSDGSWSNHVWVIPGGPYPDIKAPPNVWHLLAVIYDKPARRRTE